MRKFMPYITHTLILAIGIAIGGAVVGYTFIFKELPDTKNYIWPDARYIELGNNEKPVEYEKILGEYYLGALYLYNPLYKFKQNEGIKILESLANRGYTPAASTLYGYYRIDAFDHLKHFQGENVINNKAHFDAAYHWARLAAEQGYLANLLEMIYFYDLNKFKENIDEDLALLEKLVPNTRVASSSEMLGKIYKQQGEPEKAKYWLENAKKVKANPPKMPACVTIKPWRGW